MGIRRFPFSFWLFPSKKYPHPVIYSALTFLNMTLSKRKREFTRLFRSAFRSTSGGRVCPIPSKYHDRQTVNEHCADVMPFTTLYIIHIHKYKYITLLFYQYQSIFIYHTTMIYLYYSIIHTTI